MLIFKSGQRILFRPIFKSQWLTTVAKEKVSRKPWQTYVLYSTVLFIGAPLAVSGGFVYNLKKDQTFQLHFRDKYPDLIDWIEKLGIDLESDLSQLSADDLEQRENDQFFLTSRKQGETLIAIVKMASGSTVNIEVDVTAGLGDVHKKALAHKGVSSKDSVVDVIFADGEDEIEDQIVVAPVEENETPSPSSATSTWPKERPVRASRKISLEKRLKWELTALRGKERKLEQEMKNGTREIDVIDEELQEIIKQKDDIKKRLPRKRFLYIF